MFLAQILCWKKLRNCILRIIYMGPLFCSILVQISLHFLPTLFHFLSLSVFSVFSACSVFLFHLRKLYKIYIIIVLCQLLCDFIVKTWKNSRFRIRKTYWKMSLFWTLKETLVKQTRIFFLLFRSLIPFDLTRVEVF